MNKFDRIVSILVLLQSRKTIKATTIADQFDVSLRTVYRDIRTLETAGVPIIGEAGVGYSLVEGYKLPPVMFSRSEALALVTGEKLIGHLTDQKSVANYLSAMNKIRAVLRTSDRDSLEFLDKSIAFPGFTKIDTKDFLQEIFQVITQGKVMKLTYQKPQDETPECREVEPVGCYFYFDNWYLIAYCRIRKDYRTFKVNRISDLQVLEETIDRQHISLDEYLSREPKKGSFEKVVIKFHKDVVQHADGRKRRFGVVEEQEEGDYVLMTFFTPAVGEMAYWLLPFTDKFSVIAPDSLRADIKALATDLFNHHS